MNKEKNKNIIIIISLFLNVILLLIILLFVTGIIDFNKDENNDKNNSQNNNATIKLDETKDYVYDANYSYNNQYKEFYRGSFESTTETIDNFGIPVEYTVGMQYLSNLKVPYININNDATKNINKEIETLYLKYAKQFDLCAEDVIEDSHFGCSQILTYRTFTYNDILSVIVIASEQATSPFVLNYNVYNFDLKTGSLITYKDMIARLGYNYNDTLNEVKSLLKNKMNDLYDYVSDLTTACSENSNCYEKANDLFINSVNNNSVLFFVNKDGILNILAIPYYDLIQNGSSNYYLFEITK